MGKHATHSVVDLCSKIPPARPVLGSWILLLLFLNFGEEPLIGQTSEPTYDWIRATNMGTANASNLDNLVISIDTDSKGNVYALTFGGSIKKYDQNGNSHGSFDLGVDIESPVDMSINSQDEMYVAGYEDRKVFAFDLNGNPKPSKHVHSGYFKPLGICFDANDNLYVVEYNDGTGAENDISSRLNIYYKNGEKREDLLKDKLMQPYRIAVDSKGKIYISHAGESGSGEVVVFNNNFQQIDRLKIKSPGSIEIDKNNLIYIVDYAGKLDFNQILNYENLNIFDALLLFQKIEDGINNEKFGIRIYDSKGDYRKFINKNLDLPLDIAFFECNMYVDDAKTIENTELKFELDIFNRTKCGKEENLPPVFENCPKEKIIKETDSDKCGAIVTFTLPTATDDGEPIAVIRTDDGPKSGEFFPVGTTTVIVEADDGVNPAVKCSFDVIVEDHEEPVITCLPNITKTIPVNKNTVMVEFEEPAFFDNCSSAMIEQTAGLTSGSEFPIGKTTIEYTVTDAFGNTDSCSFAIVVIQKQENLPPVFENCPKENIIKETDSDKCGAIVTFELPTATDNGEPIPVTRIDDGPKSGELFPAGVTTIVFEADDGVKPPVECSFDVVVEDNISPTAICASKITLQLNEAGIANLTAEEVNMASKDNCSLANVEIDKTTFTENDLGENPVILTLTDAAGNIGSCKTMVIVEPYENNPTFQCKESIVLELDENGGAKLNPEMLFEGDASNYTYTLNKEDFTCANLGENNVSLTYSGPKGEGSCEIKVFVKDPNNYCIVGPVEPPAPDPGTFLIVYPNPGDGLVKIAVSSDIQLTKVDVFDLRGRLLFIKELSENSTGDYKLDIRNVQAGVYLLKLYGDDAIYYERVIISTY